MFLQLELPDHICFLDTGIIYAFVNALPTRTENVEP